MSAHDFQREIDVTSKSEVSGVGMLFRCASLDVVFSNFLR